MKIMITNKALLATVAISSGLMLSACSKQDTESSQQDTASMGDMDEQVEAYIKKFPYQDTYNYAMNYTQGDPAKFNMWVLGEEPALVKAGEDKVVRMNNDTFYKMAFMVLDNGPIILGSSAPANDRFSSFQLMDDRNANYRNIINPEGNYTLYYGKKPADIQGEAIEVPSSLAVVIVRVEVKNKDDANDVAAAEKVFNGITIDAPKLDKVPELDLLGGFDKKTEQEALQRLDKTFATVPFTDTIAGPGQEPGKDVSYINHAAGTKGGWGGPDPAHSAYDIIFTDNAGDTLNGSNGTYTITTGEPPVKAFWSITAYDTERGGFFHPNKDDRYHINNTSAVKNADGTITFVFKQQCSDQDKNCLEVPAGDFDLTARYYLPDEEIISGQWTLPKATLQK